MLKRSFAWFAFTLLLSAFSVAQTPKNAAEINWEVLEVSAVRTTYSETPNRTYRTYNYLTSGVMLDGRESLEWMKESGWELTGIFGTEGNLQNLYFKRRYDKQRTEKEIEKLKSEYKKNSQPEKQTSVLTDLDAVEKTADVAEFNKQEEVTWRKKFEQINGLPLKIIDLKSASKNAGQTVVGAEIILDATAVLLKDGNKYRSRETETYYIEAIKKISESLGVRFSSGDYSGRTKEISNGKYTPTKIGFFPSFIYSTLGMTLKTSVVINHQNQQIIVAQGVLRTNNQVIN